MVLMVKVINMMLFYRLQDSSTSQAFSALQVIGVAGQVSLCFALQAPLGHSRGQLLLASVSFVLLELTAQTLAPQARLIQQASLAELLTNAPQVGWESVIFVAYIRILKCNTLRQYDLLRMKCYCNSLYRFSDGDPLPSWFILRSSDRCAHAVPCRLLLS